MTKFLKSLFGKSTNIYVKKDKYFDIQLKYKNGVVKYKITNNTDRQVSRIEIDVWKYNFETHQSEMARLVLKGTFKSGQKIKGKFQKILDEPKFLVVDVIMANFKNGDYIYLNNV